MNQKLLCSWLGLATSTWPPDHYALLGLNNGELDSARIEQRVQDRMAKLRSYQIAHPEEATEGMNRIAQAFIYLTEQASKNGSSINLSPPPPAPPAPRVTKDDTAVGRQTVVDWRAAPPPVRQPASPPQVPEKTEPPPSVAEPSDIPKPTVQAIAAPPAPPAYDYLTALAQESAPAIRGIGTLPLLIERVEHTRRLLTAWQRVGKYLQNSARKLASRAEEKDLTMRWTAINQHLERFPRFVAQPGRPGYRVAALARLEISASMFKNMGPDQREDLTRDWETGRKVLLLHRTFLVRKFSALRRTNAWRRGIRAARSFLNDHPGWVLSGIAAGLALCALFYWWLYL